MTLPVIADTYRITLNWSTQAGVAPRNVFHVRSSGNTAAAIGALMESEFESTMFAGMASQFALLSLDVLPLDGSSATLVHGMTRSITGDSSGDFVPSTAAVCSFRTAQRGPRGRGRMYIGPCTEGVQTDGILSGTVASSGAAAWAEFMTDLAAASPAAALVVASYKHADAHDVTSLIYELILGTQRRRQSQLR